MSKQTQIFSISQAALNNNPLCVCECVLLTGWRRRLPACSWGSGSSVPRMLAGGGADPGSWGGWYGSPCAGSTLGKQTDREGTGQILNTRHSAGKQRIKILQVAGSRVFLLLQFVSFWLNTCSDLHSPVCSCYLLIGRAGASQGGRKLTCEREPEPEPDHQLVLPSHRFLIYSCRIILMRSLNLSTQLKNTENFNRLSFVKVNAQFRKTQHVHQKLLTI